MFINLAVGEFIQKQKFITHEIAMSRIIAHQQK